MSANTGSVMSREMQMRVWVIGLGVFLFLLYALSGVLTPFVAGLAVAYFLDPLADRLEMSFEIALCRHCRHPFGIFFGGRSVRYCFVPVAPRPSDGLDFASA